MLVPVMMQGKYGCGVLFYILLGNELSSLSEAQVCKVTRELLSKNSISPFTLMYQESIDADADDDDDEGRTSQIVSSLTCLLDDICRPI